MDIKYVRIAELTENIEKVNNMLRLHQNTTRNPSMIQQYECQRDEFLEELQTLFNAINLRVAYMDAA
jgi:uncharacterized coiled-coil DUF342 family protein